MDKEPFKRALKIISSRLDEGPPEEHLDLNEITHAIFDNLGNLPPHKAERIKCHMERCCLCRDLVEKEKKENPLLDVLLAWRAQGKSDEDYWKKMKDLFNKILIK